VHSFGPCPEDSENPKPPAGHTNLEFIHLDDSTGPTQDGKTRRVVRAHVMRTYQRKKQLLENDARQSSENDKRPQHNIHLKLGIRPGNAHGEVPEEAVDKIYLTHHASGGLHRDLPGADVSQSSKTGRRENGAESTGMKKTHQTQVARSERKGGGTGRRYRGTIGFTLNQSRADSLRKIGSHSHEAPVGPWGSNAWSTGERHIYTPGPKNAAPLHSIEPFNAMPSFRSPRLHELMHHCELIRLMSSRLPKFHC
jgi:hypothetical protein